MNGKAILLSLILGSAGSLQAAFVIQDISVTATSWWADESGAGSTQWVGNLTNNSRLSAPYDIAATHAPNNNAEGMWQAKAWSADPNPTITFDLVEAYNLAGLYIWNGNQALDASHIRRGVNQFEFHISTDGGVSYSLSNTFTLAVSPLPGSAISAQNFDLSGLSGVTHARIRVLSTHNSPAGGGDYASLSEVMFTGVAVPEPSALTLRVGPSGDLAPPSLIRCA